MLLQKAEALRRERALMKELARAEDDHLRAMAEENRHKFKEQMEKLTSEISALKMEAAGESSSQQGGIKREWECVMCLTEPKSMIFLPCAHQALCTACNMLHERQRMKDCPWLPGKELKDKAKWELNDGSGKGMRYVLECGKNSSFPPLCSYGSLPRLQCGSSKARNERLSYLWNANQQADHCPFSSSQLDQTTLPQTQC
nr:putative E3 ubiquitin-protein ligase RF298 [Ipomoea batatas]